MKKIITYTSAGVIVIIAMLAMLPNAVDFVSGHDKSLNISQNIGSQNIELISDDKNEEMVFYGKVVHISEKELIIASMSELSNKIPYAELLLDDKSHEKSISVNENLDNIFIKVDVNNIEIFNESGIKSTSDYIKEGMVVYIPCLGINTGGVPAALNNPQYIKVDKQASNISGLYRDVIIALYEDNKGKFQNISVFGFDLTSVKNLTQSEKSALIYRIKNENNVLTVSGTYEDLEKAGFIDKYTKVFSKGVLFTIETGSSALPNDIISEEFSFSASKWQSDMLAIGYANCIAKYDKLIGRWHFSSENRWVL